MSRRSLKTGDQDGFILAIWDDLVDTQEMFGVETEVIIRPGKMRGRLLFLVRAYKAPRTAGDEPYAEGLLEWPTHAASTLYALLYRAAVRIGGECSRRAQGLRRTDSPE